VAAPQTYFFLEICGMSLLRSDSHWNKAGQFFKYVARIIREAKLIAIKLEE
jgi:hypothetical protein